MQSFGGKHQKKKKRLLSSLPASQSPKTDNVGDESMLERLEHADHNLIVTPPKKQKQKSYSNGSRFSQGSQSSPSKKKLQPPGDVEVNEEEDEDEEHSAEEEDSSEEEEIPPKPPPKVHKGRSEKRKKHKHKHSKNKKKRTGAVKSSLKRETKEEKDRKGAQTSADIDLIRKVVF